MEKGIHLHSWINEGDDCVRCKIERKVLTAIGSYARHEIRHFKTDNVSRYLPNISYSTENEHIMLNKGFDARNGT